MTQTPRLTRADPGEFLQRSFTNEAGTRDFKLYVPAGFRGDAAPLIVMLHGCTQDPEDFSRGTRMNEFADTHGLLVLYPAQSPSANVMKCWNWFVTADQHRAQGEPSIITGMIQKIAAEYPVDRARVFVAGLSAGAAMAVIMGATYPEIFAAVGAHSGLPYRSANSVASAMAAMRNGAKVSAEKNSRSIGSASAVATIVFHGDQDSTVAVDNGRHIAAQAVADLEALQGPLKCLSSDGVSADGRAFTTTIYARGDAPSLVEYWLLRGAGHAWSGGSPTGSHTHSQGPNASAEMIRFFLAQPSKYP